MIRAAFLAAFALATPALAQDGKDPSADVRLYRLACMPPTGMELKITLNDFSDTEAYSDEPPDLTISCYLIKHGDQWMIWDTGLPQAEAGLAAQLEALGLTPADIDHVGVSHTHFDHVGNIGMFKGARLIIQQAEYDAVLDFAAQDPAQAEARSMIEEWENIARVKGDHDVFGDGSVVTLSTPGHTPGHQALLVRLPEAGPVILSGDAAHFTENWQTNGVPDFNTDRADTLASLDRLKGLVQNLDAVFVIQHEPDDIDALPKFPAYLD